MSKEFRDVDGRPLSDNIFASMWVISNYMHRNLGRDVAIEKLVKLAHSRESATKMIDETMQDESP